MMFKNMTLAVILFDMFLDPNFQKTASFANIARTTTSTSKFIYQERFGLRKERLRKKLGIYMKNNF